MLTTKLLATVSLGLIAAACVGPYDRQGPPPNVSRAPNQSERNCLDYGFLPGTESYARCVQRDASARQTGRVNRDYAQARVADDARQACSGYGLTQGSQRYDTCVSREIDARRYTGQGQISQPGQGYAYTQRAAPAQYDTPDRYPAPAYASPERVASQPVNTSGTPAFHDEFGFRYDAEGNRLDRNGRIISPQSTTP